jgi:hypothetical protein
MVIWGMAYFLGFTGLPLYICIQSQIDGTNNYEGYQKRIEPGTSGLLPFSVSGCYASAFGFTPSGKQLPVQVTSCRAQRRSSKYQMASCSFLGISPAKLRESHLPIMGVWLTLANQPCWQCAAKSYGWQPWVYRLDPKLQVLKFWF